MSFACAAARGGGVGGGVVVAAVVLTCSVVVGSDVGVGRPNCRCGDVICRSLGLCSQLLLVPAALRDMSIFRWYLW